MIQFLQIGPIGSRRDTTLFIKHKNGIRVRCGCFCGDIADFAAKVEKKHENNPQHLSEYRGAIAYANTVLNF